MEKLKHDISESDYGYVMCKTGFDFIALQNNCNFWLEKLFWLQRFDIFFAWLSCVGRDTSGKN